MPAAIRGEVDYYRRQAATARRAAVQASRAWTALDADAIDAHWRQLLPGLLDAVVTAQLTAATTAAAAPTLAGEPPADLVPAAFAGAAADGRPLETLLRLPAITALTRIGRGVTPAAALAAGALMLVQLVRSEVADAGRLAAQAAITATPEVTGYERIVVPPACTRCIVLAGKLYRWSTGFRRHPRCNCQMRPVTAEQWHDQGPAHTPEQLLDRMTPAQKRRAGFTEADQQAFDAGADLAQLVNARRGAHGLAPVGARLTREERLLLQGGRQRGRVTPVRLYGRDLYVTTEGTTVRGLAGQRLGARGAAPTPGNRYRRATAPRLLPQSIFAAAAGDRELAVRLLRRNGYIR